MSIIKIADNNQFYVKYICSEHIETDQIFEYCVNPDKINELTGYYSFIIFNKKNKENILVTDIFNSYRIYYSLKDKWIDFHIKSPKEKVELYVPSLKNYFKTRYIFSPYTVFAGVYTTSPGSIVYLKDWNIKQNISYSFNFSRNKVDVNEFDRFIHEYMEEFIRKNIKQDSGLFLSGGMDSSGIAYFLKKYIKESRLKAYSVIFPGKVFDEKNFSDEVSTKLEIQKEDVRMTSGDYIDFWEKMPEIFSQPVSTHTGASFYKIFASSDEKTLISGYGGDELFGGDIKYIQALRLKEFYDYAERNNVKLNKNNDFEDFITFYNNNFNIEFNSNKDFLNSCIDYNLRYWQSDYENFVTGEMGIFFNKSFISPYLGRKFVEYVNSLDKSMKISGHVSRYIYRKWIKNLYGEKFAFRPSQGFSAPLNNMFRNELSDYVMIKLENFLKRDYMKEIIDFNEIKDNLNMLQNGENRYNYVLSVIILENFLNYWEKDESIICLS